VAKAKRSDLRQRLLRAAAEQIRTKGAEGFSLRETARTVGVDPAMVYREFADRAELVECVALEGSARMSEAVAEAVGGVADPEARLVVTGETYIRFALDNPSEFQVMFAGGIRPVLPTEVPSTWHQLRAVLGELERAGRLRLPLEEAALVCWTSVHGTARLLVDGALSGYPISDPAVAVRVVVGHMVSSLLVARA
jgi:AcrR family transcriptional regulator